MMVFQTKVTIWARDRVMVYTYVARTLLTHLPYVRAFLLLLHVSIFLPYSVRVCNYIGFTITSSSSQYIYTLPPSVEPFPSIYSTKSLFNNLYRYNNKMLQDGKRK